MKYLSPSGQAVISVSSTLVKMRRELIEVIGLMRSLKLSDKLKQDADQVGEKIDLLASDYDKELDALERK